MECCFEFVMNFLNIEKKIRIFCFNISYFLHVYAISKIKKKNWCTKKNSGGGGVSNFLFCFRKTLVYHFISRFMLFSTLKLEKNIEKCPFTYWLNGRWFIQIVDGDSMNL